MSSIYQSKSFLQVPPSERGLLSESFSQLQFFPLFQPTEQAKLVQLNYELFRINYFVKQQFYNITGFIVEQGPNKTSL